MVQRKKLSFHFAFIVFCCCCCWLLWRPPPLLPSHCTETSIFGWSLNACQHFKRNRFESMFACVCDFCTNRCRCVCEWSVMAWAIVELLLRVVGKRSRDPNLLYMRMRRHTAGAKDRILFSHTPHTHTICGQWGTLSSSVLVTLQSVTICVVYERPIGRTELMARSEKVSIDWFNVKSLKLQEVEIDVYVQVQVSLAPYRVRIARCYVENVN